MKDSGDLFWDSCVFIRYLTGDAGDDIFDEISHFVEEAKVKNPKWRIHYSTLIYTEIRNRFIKQGGYGSFQSFLDDLGGSFSPIEPNPNILLWAGELRDSQAVNPSDPKMPDEKVRCIGTPDAIHFMTCQYAKVVLGMSDITFHTLDEGKGTNWEGRCVPLLGFERWFPVSARTKRVAEVIELERSKPLHPRPVMKGTIRGTRPIDLNPSA